MDDEVIILMSLRMELRKGLGGQIVVETATDLAGAMEAAEGLKKEGVKLSCLITDWMLPDVPGDELALKVRSVWPALPVILMTGHADSARAERTLSSGGPFSVLRKPWQAPALIECVKAFLEL
ncbi:MAG: response regulator [Spirochaetales bacterium]|nr:response regulator [Spirochaetales bacterium]MBP7263705.1 response regulator [Spirochaetia bacterium]